MKKFQYKCSKLQIKILSLTYGVSCENFKMVEDNCPTLFILSRANFSSSSFAGHMHIHVLFSIYT